MKYLLTFLIVTLASVSSIAQEMFGIGIETEDEFECYYTSAFVEVTPKRVVVESWLYEIDLKIVKHTKIDGVTAWVGEDKNKVKYIVRGYEHDGKYGFEIYPLLKSHPVVTIHPANICE